MKNDAIQTTNKTIASTVKAVGNLNRFAGGSDPSVGFCLADVRSDISVPPVADRSAHRDACGDGHVDGALHFDAVVVMAAML